MSCQSLWVCDGSGKKICENPHNKKKKKRREKQNSPNDAPLRILFPLGEGVRQVEETIAGHSLPWNSSAQQLRRASHEDATWRLVPDCRISAQCEQTTVTFAASALQNIAKNFRLVKVKKGIRFTLKWTFTAAFISSKFDSVNGNFPATTGKHGLLEWKGSEEFRCH